MGSDHSKFQVWTKSGSHIDSAPATLDISHDKRTGTSPNKQTKKKTRVAFFLFSPPPDAHLLPSPLPAAELVRDFRCVIQVNELNCSWIPVNASLNLTVSYR